jgi:hypothetical protein
MQSYLRSVNRKENAGQATGEKKTIGQPIYGSVDEPYDGRRGPGGDHGDRSPRGRRGAETWMAAVARVWIGLV